MFHAYESSRSKKIGRTSTNLYLQYKWDCMNYENHRYNIKTAKSKIDNKAPRTFPHLYYRPKKLQVELERFCAIQRDNKHLMDRLATIQREGAWIDNKNFHKIKSLNTWKRQQEMIELSYNNQTMLSRLLDCHSQYNHHKLEDEYLLSRKHKAIVEKYPEDWRKVMYKMKIIKKHLREKVINARTGKTLKDRVDKKELKIIEKEADALEQAEQEAKRMQEEKGRESTEKSERLKAVEERKRAMADWKEASTEWRKAREERLRLAEEKKSEEERKLAKVKEREKKRQKEKREKLKKEVEEWRKWKDENERIKKEKEKVEKEEQRKKAAEARRKFKAKEKAIQEKKAKATEKQIVASDKEVKEPLKAVIFFEGGQDVDVIEKDIVKDFKADITELKAQREEEEKNLQTKESSKPAKSIILPLDLRVEEDPVHEAIVSESKLKIEDHGLEEEYSAEILSLDKRSEDTKQLSDEGTESTGENTVDVEKRQPGLSAVELFDDLKVEVSGVVVSKQSSDHKTLDSSDENQEVDLKTEAIKDVDSVLDILISSPNSVDKVEKEERLPIVPEGAESKETTDNVPISSGSESMAELTEMPESGFEVQRKDFKEKEE